MEIDAKVYSTEWRWPLLLSVIFLNVCLPSLVLCYGVLLQYSVVLGVPLPLGFSAPTILILTYGLTQSWCREAADTWGGPVGYRVMAALGLLLVVLSLLLCAFIPFYWQPIVYGVLGGLGSSIISAQVDAVVFETYDSYLGIIRGLCFTGQAIGQAVFPHILYALVNSYGYSYSYIVLGGIMLQTLPAIMLLKTYELTKRPISYSRYTDASKNYSLFSHRETNNISTNLQLHDMSKKCWRNPSDDSIYTEEEFENVTYDNLNATITPPPSPEDKRRNIFGVEILPEIPEESETDEDESPVEETNKKGLSVAIKRLSTMGDNLSEYISKQMRRDSESNQVGPDSQFSTNANTNENRNYTEIEVTYENVSSVTDVQREKIFNSFSFRCQSTYVNLKRRFWIPSYKVYRLKRRLLFCIYNLNDTFMKPLTRSLSCWRFYLSLLLCFSKLSLSAVSLVLLPMIATQMKPKISSSESNFLMTLHGFTWTCFLLSTPWLASTPKRNFKYIAVIGLWISTVACFLIAIAESHDMFSIGCVIGGLGYGTITSTWETSVQDFVGARKWPKFHSVLETLSSTSLALFVTGLSFVMVKNGGLQYSIFILGIVFSVITFVWTILALVSLYSTKVGSIRRCR